jgi:hypothetical protein
MSQNTGDPQKASTPKAAPAPTPAASDDFDDEPAAKVTPAPQAESTGGDSRAQDILAMIRNRQK